MKEIQLTSPEHAIDQEQLTSALQTWLESSSKKPQYVLLLPPDLTRMHSQAGLIVQLLYQMLSPACRVDIMPTLGTHLPMSQPEIQKMFGTEIPLDRFLAHDWRNDVVKIGTVPADYVTEISAGLVNYPIDIEINRGLIEGPGHGLKYDLIVSIGQVVPHEVAGMAGYYKNILVGSGGKDIINKSHFLGAVYGMERIMGRDNSPVHRIFDYARDHFLKDIPLQYILTVTSTAKGKNRIDGLFIGAERRIFEAAVRLSQKRNLTILEKPLSKVVVYLNPEEFKSTWLGNKAIYRTRMVMADGGELIIIAPGVRRFGEDEGIDRLIRKYGYVGSKRILELVTQEADLQNNLSVAAHLIHGSSEGRFKITYAPGQLTEKEIRQANYNYMSYEEAIEKYSPSLLLNGLNRLKDGAEIFYIDNPALGLWALAEKFRGN
jgi:nickel-dependent lactate racemase